MNNVNWKQKLSSRKFWVAVVGFVTPLLIAFNVDQLTVEQIGAIITSGGVLISYILAEGNVDASRNQNKERDDVQPIPLVEPKQED